MAMDQRDGRQKKTEQTGRQTYRVINEPFKIMGIIDWRYAFAAAVPAIAIWLLSGSKVAGLIALPAFLWQAWRFSEDDASLPIVWYLTFFERSQLDPFKTDKTIRVKA